MQAGMDSSGDPSSCSSSFLRRSVRNPANPAPSSGTDVDVDADAALIYNYHRMGMPVRRADAIFALCSLDLRVAEHAAHLYLSGLAPLLIFSGGSGVLTASHTRIGEAGLSEAAAFAAVARRMGVPDAALVLEERSTNTGENVRFTAALLDGWGLRPRSFLLVQKPYMERRTWATFAKQWPGRVVLGEEDVAGMQAGDDKMTGNEEREGGEGIEESKEPGVTFRVTSPPLQWAEYPDADNPRDLVINVMVGDLMRIRDYPARGFQVEQHIPPEVWAAAERLVAAGYDAHLPKP